MDKIHFSKSGDASTVSNVAIKVNGAKAELIDIEKADKDKVFAGTHSIDLVDNKPVLTEIPEIPEKINPINTAKKDLKDKLDAGTATDEDIKEALKLLL